MRRDIRRHSADTWVVAGVAISIIILVGVVSFIVKNFRDNKENSNLQMNNEEMAISEKDYYEEASTEYGKSVEESKNEMSDIEENTVEEEIEENEINDLNIATNTDVNETDEKEENIVSEIIEEDTVQEEKEEISFSAPVKGEIIREFAVESLVYSETLQEWITHNGVDIKADKTTVVTSVAKGKVKAIKNDPRYGLTVIIDHDDGYQTIYSNLLTAEFVVEGEEVEQGQTIGTVGSTAAFEISDDYHLHFELLKDNQYIDPTIYMSFE